MNDFGPKSEQRSQEEIINDVTKEIRNLSWEDKCKFFPDQENPDEKPEDFEPDPNLWLAVYGKKALKLRIDEKDDTLYLTAHIENTKDSEEKKDETFIVYSAGLKKIQEITDTKNKIVKWYEGTGNESMARFALTKGREIIDFETLKIRARKQDNTYGEMTEEEFLSIPLGEVKDLKFSFTTTIYPESND